MAQMLPYDHKQVENFSKETPYVIYTGYARFFIASLHKLRGSYAETVQCPWVWVTCEGGNIIDGADITHWLNIHT